MPQGLSTLLAEGPLASLPSLQQLPAQQQIPIWLRRPFQAPSLSQQLLLREAGLCNRRSSRLPLRTVAGRLCHHATFRGHGFPVFCVLFDKQGSRVVTGADDAIIKVSSAGLSLPQLPCMSAIWAAQLCQCKFVTATLFLVPIYVCASQRRGLNGSAPTRRGMFVSGAAC